jgi:TIR domain
MSSGTPAQPISPSGEVSPAVAVGQSKPKIFISYTSHDRDWAHWIGVTLRDNGYSPFVHEWEVGAGENIARWMDESIAAADRLLGVFTDAYIRALFSSSERWATYWDHGTESRLTLI